MLLVHSRDSGCALLCKLWIALVLVFIYLPVLCGAVSSLSKSRYFIFPLKAYSWTWWERTFNSLEIHTLVCNSLLIAIVVTVISTLIAFGGALAFARYSWRGKRLYQKIILLPIFFPQPVLGLALLLWFNTLGLELSWATAAFAHLVWITPVVTLVIAIQVYGFDPTLEVAARDLGASPWQIFREITLPLLWPGIWSGMLFAFLLSWGNFPLSLYTTGVDNTIPKWLFSKMSAGYTPMVPALGTMSTIAMAAIMIVGGLLVKLHHRHQGRA
ncbi:MAG: ABC transporter permease [Candidatus Anaerobiospirillum merdipullorum]|uniref:ABC transporter permease n=1 Tax=Candidatus Anaerobiospirillum merdipullorum TaxID=2838450 RepID=A0A9E2KQD6_9GAMM|nr:ABC transporter permease [Candidatus Anaerobiospirillum merdipullorum]